MLKELRENKLMTQKELSIRSGVSVKTISKIENSFYKCKGLTKNKLANALGVDVKELN